MTEMPGKPLQSVVSGSGGGIDGDGDPQLVVAAGLVATVSTWALLDWVALVASVLSIVLALSLGFEIRELQLHRDRGTSSKSFLPYLSMVLNGTLSAIYGQLIAQIPILMVNALNAVIALVFACMFYHFTHPPDRALLHRQIVVLLLFAGTIGVYFVTLPSEGLQQVTFMGLLQTILTVVMFASPLGILASVFRTRDVSPISIPLCLASLLCSLAWLWYVCGWSIYFVT